MNREEALKLLRGGKKGVEEWNRRRAVGEEIPNLENVNLSVVDLLEIDLGGVSFYGAHLDLVDLSKANLTGTCFYEADLNLVDLSEADLRAADFNFATLTGVNLEKANLSGAIFGYTTLADIDLSVAQGLEESRHFAPSTVGIDTLFRSKGKIPKVFLQGCGVPDALIESLPSLIASLSPIQFYSCFISYSHKDEEFCQRLHGRMQQEGLRVWYAPEKMKGGKKTHEQIDEAIRVYDKLLLVLSEASMASEWVATEIYHARQREVKEKRRLLFPIRLVPFDKIRDWECFDADTGKDMAREIREYFIPDFSNWTDDDAFEASFTRLLEDLRAEEAE